jgi:group II intron reverse transcriptase/maturase
MAKGSRVSDCEDLKENEMFNNTRKVITIYSERGVKRLPLQGVYRQLYKPELYELAYSQIYANPGANTKGTGEETLDGMSKERINKIIQRLKKEQYRWRPVRRTYIPKSDGRRRPLGIPSGDDKLLQAAIKILLEAYYEPRFSHRSHGFRPKRGCHTALLRVSQKHRGANWFIEGDIKGCFDNIDHETLIKIMAEDIEDNRLLSLIRKLLKAGYMEDWLMHRTYSGTPQGGIISPILTNIYMDKFDKWVESELLTKYNRMGSDRGKRENPEYARLSKRRYKAKIKGDLETYKQLGELRKNMPSVIVDDPEYRKLEFIRYADDFLLSFSGPKHEAKEIKERISEFLRTELKLEMSEAKTLITHAKSDRAIFLGYEISTFMSKDKPVMNGKIRLSVPKEVVTKAIRKYSKNGKPVHRTALMQDDDLEIIWRFQAEYKGLVEYYRMAHNIHTLSQVGMVTQASLIKTLAAKHDSKVTKMWRRYGATHEAKGIEYKVVEARIERKGKKDKVARFGAVSLARNPMPARITDEIPVPHVVKSQLIDRLNAEECEMCGYIGDVEVHHVRALRDLNKPGRKNKPAWVHKMAAMNRKTLIVCRECHLAVTYGKHLTKWDQHRNRHVVTPDEQ